MRPHRARAGATRSIGKPARQSRPHHAEGGNHTREERGSHGCRDGKDRCPEVDLDALKPGHRGRPEQHDHADERDREEESRGAAGDREGGRFEDHLHGEPATTGTKRGPDRKFTAATDASCEQQVRDIRTRQQQDESDRRHQQADRASRARRDLLDKRHDVRAPRPVIRKLALDLRLDVVHLAIRGLDRRSGRKPADDREIVRAALAGLEVRRMRDPQFGRAPPAACRETPRRADRRTPAASRR